MVLRQKYYEEKMPKIISDLIIKISDYLGVNIHVRIVKEDEADKGQVLQEIGNYKNIDVRIVEEIEK